MVYWGVLDGAHWRHLANTTEPFMCGGDVTLSNYFDTCTNDLSKSPSVTGNSSVIHHMTSPQIFYRTMYLSSIFSDM